MKKKIPTVGVAGLVGVDLVMVVAVVEVTAVGVEDGNKT
jgi:hypothetical protein